MINMTKIRRISILRSTRFSSSFVYGSYSPWRILSASSPSWTLWSRCTSYGVSARSSSIGAKPSLPGAVVIVRVGVTGLGNGVNGWIEQRDTGGGIPQMMDSSWRIYRHTGSYSPTSRLHQMDINLPTGAEGYRFIRGSRSSATPIQPPEEGSSYCITFYSIRCVAAEKSKSNGAPAWSMGARIPGPDSGAGGARVCLTWEHGRTQ